MTAAASNVPPRTGRGGVAAVATAATLLAAVLALLPGAVFAHAEYARSTPADGSTVAKPPERIDVWFTQEMFKRTGANTLRVTGPAGEAVPSPDAVLDDLDRTHLSVALPAGLAPGAYEVAWTTLSAVDGDTAEGVFAFTFDPDAAPVPAPPLPAASAPDGEAAGAGAAATATSPLATAEAGEEAVPGTAPGTAVAVDSGMETAGDAPLPSWVLIAGASVLLSGALGVWAIGAVGGAGSPDANG